MLSKSIIYPRVESTQTTVEKKDKPNEFEVIFRHSTWLRKQHTDGKWYLCLILTQDTFDKNDFQNITDVVMSLHKFHVNVYRFLIDGIPKYKMFDGIICCEEDLDQRDETERVGGWI